MEEPSNSINDLYRLRVFGDFNGEIKLSDDLDEISKALEDIVVEYCKDILDERKENKNMEILKIYKERKNTQLLNDYEKELAKINQENPFEIIIKEAVEQIQELYSNEYKKELNDFILVSPTIGLSKLKTKETIEKENKLTAEYKKSINELDDLIKEVEARLELAENNAEKVKILKSYDILDKNGKINA